MLELDITANKFLSQIGKFLEQETEIRANTPEISIHCKDIDEGITKVEVYKALRKEFDLIGYQNYGKNTT